MRFPLLLLILSRRITVCVDDGLLAEALVSGARGVGSDGEVDVAGRRVDGDLALGEDTDQGRAGLLVAREGGLGLGGSILSRDGGDGDEEGGKKGCGGTHDERVANVEGVGMVEKELMNKGGGWERWRVREGKEGEWIV